MRPEQTVEHAAALAEITRTITASLDADTIFGVLEREAPYILPHHRLWVLLRSDQKLPDQWSVVYASPLRDPLPQPFLISDVSFGAALLANQAAAVTDFATTAPSHSWDQVILDDGGRSGVVVPIHVATQVLGGLLFTQATPGAYGVEDIAVIEPVAGLLALALEHERLDQQASSLAVVEERNRLAREIHDTLAQSLTAIILNLEALKLYAPSRLPTELEILAETEALARSALVEARRSVLGLQPVPLAHQTLSQALAQELAAFGQRAGVTTHFHVQGVERNLAPDQATALFRIAHETWQNIFKHAAAHIVRVDLTFETDMVTLSVEDDGRGFAPQRVPTPDWHGGSGLLGMKARARQLGGVLEITASPGHGTLVRATLPYAQNSSEGVVLMPRETGIQQTHPTRVLIVDDHPVLRQGLRRILDDQADLEVVGEAEDGLAAIDKVRALQPDVVLLDLQMPRLGGIDAIPQLRAAMPRIEIVILTTFDQEEQVFAALKAGARGYSLKDAAPEALLATIRAAARGESLLPVSVATRVVERFAVLSQRETDPDALNARELEVLRLMAHGMPYKTIGVELHITTKTVQYHVGNILGKLHVRSRGEAVAAATERGLLA